MKPRLYSLLAELTHRCPLHCPYCSNPTTLSPRTTELETAEWKTVLHDAAALGALHVGFSGGEPLLRNDLAELIASAREAGLYSNLITSGIGFVRAKAEALKHAGLDSVQISFQADEPALANRIAGTSAHEAKLAAAHLARELEFPLTVNVVLHRANIEQLENIIALAESVHAQRLELANTQFYGWAFRNRAVLLPTRAQVENAVLIATAAKKRLRGCMEILFVIPDYYSDRPKPCMHGWANRHLTVNPAGIALPCPTAMEIPGMRFETVRERSLRWIWEESEAFNRFRGTDWMPDPCRSCEFRAIDFGGCRCQAALLTGDPAVTDPACSLSPYRKTLASFVEQVQSGDTPLFEEVAFRQNP